ATHCDASGVPASAGTGGSGSRNVVVPLQGGPPVEVNCSPSVASDAFSGGSTRPHSGPSVVPVPQAPKLSRHQAGTPVGAWSRPSCSVVPSSGALRSRCTIGQLGQVPFAHGRPLDVAPPHLMLRSISGSPAGGRPRQDE